jgi:hypothetical protein
MEWKVANLNSHRIDFYIVIRLRISLAELEGVSVRCTGAEDSLLKDMLEDKGLGSSHTHLSYISIHFLDSNANQEYSLTSSVQI